MDNSTKNKRMTNTFWKFLSAILAVAFISCETKAQKKYKAVPCYVNSIIDTSLEYKYNTTRWGAIGTFYEMADRRACQDTANFPPVEYIKYVGDTAVPDYKDVKEPCALYVIKEEGEPICIAAFKITKKVMFYRHSLYEDKRTKRHYTDGGGSSDFYRAGDDPYKYVSHYYVDWQGKQFDKSVKIIKEKELK